MKKLIFSLIIFTSIISQAQNWEPISLETKSVFIEDTYPTPLVCFSIDSVQVLNSDTSIFYNYQLYGTNPNSFYNPAINCPQGWGCTCGIIANVMSWFGREIKKTTTHWEFTNLNQNVLKFNFTSTDTSIVYSDSFRTLKMVKVKDTVSSFLNIQDSVKLFSLLHYNSQGNLLNDEFYNKKIRLSKNRGLLDFINIRNYPDDLDYFSIYGSKNNTDTIGITHIKEYEAYRKAPGTEYQYEYRKNGYYTSSGYVPEVHFYNFYSIVSESFIGTNYVYNYLKNTTSYTETIDTNIVFFNLPFTQDKLNRRAATFLDSTECYGTLIYSDIIFNDGYSYCANGDCYTCVDINDFYTDYHYLLVPSIGNTIIYQHQAGPTPNPSDVHTYELIYTKVNGIECGTREYLGLENKNRYNIQVFPNPVNDKLKILIGNSVLKSTNLRIEITDLSGKIVKNKSINELTSSLDISQLTNGVYTCTILSENRPVYRVRIIKN